MANTFRLLVAAVAIACTFAGASAQVNTDSIQSVYRLLNRALADKSPESILPVLHPDFSVSIATRPKAEGYLSSLLGMQVLRSVEFDGTASLSGDTILAGSIFADSKGRDSRGHIALDRNYRLLYVDFFDQLYSPSRHAQSRFVCDIPFEVSNGSIILNLRLNESSRVLRFLFDTGADGMAIGKSLGDSLGLVVARRKEAQVVGGSAQVDISSGNTVHLTDTFALQSQNIALFERVAHSGIDGIIGLNLAYSYVVRVDFDERRISLFTMGDHRFEGEGRTIDVTVPDGIMRLPASIDIAGRKEVTGSFVFDTGANYHAICFEGFVRRNRLLLNGFKSQGQGTTVSMGISSPVYHGTARSFSLGESREEDMPVTLQASTGRVIKEGEPDGSIGVRLLSRFNFTIDLLNKKVHLVPNGNTVDIPVFPVGTK